MQIRRSLVVVLVGAAVAAGCGGESDDSSATAATSVTRSEVTDPPATTAAPTTAPPATTAPAPATTSAPPPADGGGDGGGGGGGGDEAVLPDAVGLDLQLAQDTMQASGFYFLTSHDASGEGRLQILDRNWKVCDQTPAGGAPTSPGTLIDFGAVKDDESCGAG
jgi:hypothetical protein